MTQFQTAGPSIVNAMQQAPLAQKKKQTQDRLSNPTNRLRLRDRRDQALLDQGVDPDQLRRGTRDMRGQLDRLMRESRRAFQSGNAEQGESLRAQADELRLGINDRFKLSRPTLGDLPEREQMQQRAESRAQLQAQLPQIAQNARAREDQAGAQNTQRLARIGRQAYRLEIGGNPPQNMSDEAFADFARSADRNVIDRVTRGVGLPESPQTGDADRLSRLAQTGVQFDDFAPRRRQDDPDMLRLVRTGQAQGRLDSDARLTIRNNEREAAVAGSQLAPAQAENAVARERETEPLLRNTEEAQARLSITQAQREAQNTQTQAELDQIEGQRALDRAQSDRPAEQGTAAQQAGLPSDTQQQVQEADLYLNQIGESFKDLKDAKATGTTEERVEMITTAVNQLEIRQDWTPEQKRIVVKNILDQIGDDPFATYKIRDTFWTDVGQAIKPWGKVPSALSDSTQRLNENVRQAINKLRVMAGLQPLDRPLYEVGRQEREDRLRRNDEAAQGDDRLRRTDAAS